MSQTVWDTLGVALPDLEYNQDETQSQQKGSTEWAAHSHTPVSVVEWTDFHTKIEEASRRPGNTCVCTGNASERMSQQDLKTVQIEQHVTDNTETLLRAALRTVDADFRIYQDVRFTQSDPDMIAERSLTGAKPKTIPASKYQSPQNRAKVKRDLIADKSILFTFETKPFWKFRFLSNDPTQSTSFLTSQWQYPEGYSATHLLNKAPLPKEWSSDKQKVFHLIRQLYGQMVSSQLRYGIIHIYEVWWFCCRDAQGNLRISPPAMKEATSPSVLQIIKAMAGFDDLFLEEVTIHPGSATKAANPKPEDHKRKRGGSGESPGRGGRTNQGGRGQGSIGTPNSRSLGTTSSADPEGFASRVFMWDCKLLDFTANTKILLKKSDPSVLIKIPHHPHAGDVVKEIETEAAIYRKLARNSEVQGVIPSFYGFSTHLGVPMLCIGREGPDFEDIGVENLSDALKASAVQCLRRLGRAGVVHHDLALRNIVQSAEDPHQAKIIDFGRAEFTQDQRLLQEQVAHLETLLAK